MVFQAKSRIFLRTHLILIIFNIAVQSFAQVAAFPGAEGFGKFTTGGRGGKVYVVTNLEDSGPGSLREFIQKKGTRIIVFAVSGTIALESPLIIKSGDLTIAGQTAPGDGITIRNFPVKIEANNVIIRYMRFRLGDERKVEDDALGGSRVKNVIIDHCSISWATDECASFYQNENFTLQWCIISESLNKSVHTKGEHGYGGIWGGKNASFHHNLIASHNSRLPRFSGSPSVPNLPDELVDFRNNVIYNWMNNNIYGGEKGRYNVVNNFFKPGPATRSGRKNYIINPSEPYGKFYLNGNVLEGNKEVTKWNQNGVLAKYPDSCLTLVPFTAAAITQHSARKAYKLVLKYAGSSYVRDEVDKRIIEEVRSGTSYNGKDRNGIIDSQADVGGWPLLKSWPPPDDVDADGMPDVWERRNGLNPFDPNDASAYSLSKSYTNIELYINSLVKKIP